MSRLLRDVDGRPTALLRCLFPSKAKPTGIAGAAVCLDGVSVLLVPPTAVAAAITHGAVSGTRDPTVIPAAAPTAWPVTIATGER